MDRKSSSWNVSLDFVIVLNLYIVVIYLSSGLRKLFQIYGPLTEIEHFFHFDIVDWLYVVYFRESSWVKRRFWNYQRKTFGAAFWLTLYVNVSQNLRYSIYVYSEFCSKEKTVLYLHTFLCYKLYALRACFMHCMHFFKFVIYLLPKTTLA